MRAAGIQLINGAVEPVQLPEPRELHSAPLREQGCWAEWLVVPARDCAWLPPGVPFEDPDSTTRAENPEEEWMPTEDAWSARWLS